MTTPENINIIISTVSACATVAAAIIYFKTLEALRKQTSNTYRPHLFIDSIYFSVLGVHQDKNIIPTYWADENVPRNTVYEFSQEQNNHDFDLKCYNIGFGTAKKISTTFNYDLNLLLNKITSLEPYIDKNKQIKIDSKKDLILFTPSSKHLPYMTRAISYKNTLNCYLSYILPVNISNSHAPIRIPCLYPELLNIYVYYLSLAQKDKEFDLNKHYDGKLPEIDCTITYDDIYNQKQKLDISITVKLLRFGISGYQGHFEIKEK